MPAPTNYNLDVRSPFETATQGINNALAIRQVQDKEDAQAAALAVLKQKQADVRQVAMNPNRTQEDINRLRMLYPEDDAAFSGVWKSMDDAQQQSSFRTLSQVQFALDNGDLDTAKTLLQDEEAAARNSGDAQRADGSQALRRLIDLHPEAPAAISYQLERLRQMAPQYKEFMGNVTAHDTNARANALQPFEVRKAKAGAESAEIERDNLPQKLDLANRQVGETILTAQQARQLASLKAQLEVSQDAREQEKLQLEIDKIEQAKGQPQDMMDSLTNSLDTVDQMMNHTALKGWAGGAGFWGKVMGAVPGSDSADLAVLVQQLKSQQFLAQVKQLKSNGGSGLGALSDSEGARLESAIANIDTSQSREQFMAQLKIIKRYLNKAQATVIATQGKRLPGRGQGAPVLNSPTHGLIREGDINRLLKMFPGSTREDAISYLSQPQRTPD